MTAVSRRHLLAALAATPFAAALASRPARATGTPHVTQAGLDTVMRIRNRLDGKPCYWWYQGTFFINVRGEVTKPIFYIEGASVTRATKQPDGSYETFLDEAGFFCDLDTQEILNSWKNPWNGLDATPRHYRSPQRNNESASGVKPLMANLPAGMEYRGVLTEPVFQSGQVWASEELFVRRPNAEPGEAGKPDSPGPWNVQTSLATWQASEADLRNEKLVFVPSTLAYNTLATPRPWLRLGDRSAMQMWRLYGAKVQSPDELPKRIRERVDAAQPDLLKS
jgi:hypothetical protein